MTPLETAARGAITIRDICTLGNRPDAPMYHRTRGGGCTNGIYTGRGVQVHADGAVTLVTWDQLRQVVLVGLTPELHQAALDAEQRWTDLVLAPKDTWRNHATDPAHKALLEVHRRRLAIATDAMNAARTAVIDRGLTATVTTTQTSLFDAA